MAYTIKIDEESLLDALMSRVQFWTDDYDILELYRQYYESAVYGHWYEGSEVDIMSIVDNDYVNWMSVYSDEDMEDEDWITEDRIMARYNGLNLVDAS